MYSNEIYYSVLMTVMRCSCYMVMVSGSQGLDCFSKSISQQNTVYNKWNSYCLCSLLEWYFALMVEIDVLNWECLYSKKHLCLESVLKSPPRSLGKCMYQSRLTVVWQTLIHNLTCPRHSGRSLLYCASSISKANPIYVN